MSTMVERVARSIYEKRNGHGCRPWSRQPEAYRAPYLDDARAAIEAMEARTEEMRISGAYILDQRPSEAETTYRAMIQAALKEQE